MIVNTNNITKCSKLNIENESSENILNINYFEYIAKLVGVSQTLTDDK